MAVDSREDRSARIGSLMLAARDGDDDALHQIVTELSPLLWQVARTAGLNSADAEDVVQTTWMRLLSHLDRIHTPGSLIAWLVKTARYEAWDVSAAGRKQAPTEMGWLSARPDEAPGSEEQVIIDEQQRALWAAIRKLSPVCQELLRVVAFVPRPHYGEVSARLGMAVGSIGPTRGRCLAKLRAILDDHPDRSSP